MWNISFSIVAIEKRITNLVAEAKHIGEKANTGSLGSAAQSLCSREQSSKCILQVGELYGMQIISQ